MKTETINKILTEIDDFADSSKDIHQIARKYVDVRTYYEENRDQDNAQKYQWIIEVLSFNIDGEEIIERMSGTTENGKVWKYPNISKFTNEAYKTIELELAKTKSIKLKAHYADFLWISEKDYKKAQIALENYFELINFYEEKDKKDPSAHIGLDVLNAFQRAFTIAQQINFKKDEVRSELERLVFKFNHNSISKNKLTIALIEIAITHRKAFSEECFQRILSVCAERAKSLLKVKHFPFARNFLQNAHEIETVILDTLTDKWQRMIAKSFLTESQNNQENFIGLVRLTDAIAIYEQLGDTKTVDEMKQKYKELSKKVQFNEICHKTDAKPLIEAAKKQAERLLKLEPEDILSYLTVNKNLFPQYLQVKKSGEELSNKYIYRRLATQITFDQNMNLAKQTNDGEDRFFQDYHLNLSNHCTFLNVLFEKLISENKLQWKDVKNFFQKHSWFGKEYEIEIRGGEVMKTEKWINLLEPSLKLYFSTAKKFYESKRKKYPHSEIMLSTESLCLKIEGLIRELFQKLGIPTSVSKRMKGGETTLSERDLNSFLNDEKSTEIFGEDLVSLMKAILIEKDVYNLRNNVAHCFLMREHYTLIHMHLLLIIILRIGNYTFSGKKDGES